MKKLGWLAVCAVLWTGTTSSAQPEGLVSTISIVGRLNPGSAADHSQIRNLQAFQAGMQALGHEEGRTYILEALFAEGEVGRLPALAAKLVQRRPAVILAGGGAAVRAVRAATRAIPIVMATFAGDPVSSGFVASLARPGGNVTGIAGLLEELNVKQFELLREIPPGLSRVAVLYNRQVVPRNRLRTIAEAGSMLGLAVHYAAIARPEDLESAFRTMRTVGAEAIVVIPEPAVIARKRARIAALALSYRLPSVFTFRTFAEAGGLLSYSQDLVALHRRSAIYVDKILKGANPADLPVQRPARFELVVNLKTARALGIVMPPAILLRADKVIE